MMGMTFIVDCMLGKLARWLRILGFDALYFNRIGDDELLAIAQREARVLLSRDNALVQKARSVKSLLLVSERWREQVREVLDAFDLWGRISPYTRCLECNVSLKEISRENARPLIPSFVHEHAARFSLCPRCGRVYWQGTHYKDMKQKIEEILDQNR